MVGSPILDDSGGDSTDVDLYWEGSGGHKLVVTIDDIVMLLPKGRWVLFRG